VKVAIVAGLPTPVTDDIQTSRCVAQRSACGKRLAQRKAGAIEDEGSAGTRDKQQILGHERLQEKLLNAHSGVAAQQRSIRGGVCFHFTAKEGVNLPSAKAGVPE
jgi:hypothetical protein